MGHGQTKGGKYADKSNQTAEEVPGTADKLPAMENQGNVNEEGTSDKKAWDTMGQEEVQNKLDDAKTSDIHDIDIISQYWRQSNSNMMVRVTGLYTIRDEAIKEKDVEVNHPD